MHDEMADRIKELNRKRFEFLRNMYELTGGSRYKLVMMYELGEELGFSKEETELVVEYLVGEGLAKHEVMGGGIVITHRGRIQVEEAISHPDERTDYFPALNYIYVETMMQSQIQQGTTESIQKVVYSEQDVEALQDFIREFRDRLPDLDLDETAKAQAQADLASLEAQTTAPKPTPSIVSECLNSLRAILLGIATQAGTQVLLSQIGEFLGSGW